MKTFIIILFHLTICNIVKGQDPSIKFYINSSSNKKIKKNTCYEVTANDKKIFSIEEYNEFGKMIKYIENDINDNSRRSIENFSYQNDTTINMLQEFIYSKNDIESFLNYAYDNNRKMFHELKKYKLDSLELITNYSYVKDKVIVIRKFKNSIVDSFNVDNPFLVEKTKSDSIPRNYYHNNNEIVSKRVLKNNLIEENHYRENDSLLTSTSKYLLNGTEKVFAYRDTLFYDKKNRVINQTVWYSWRDYFPNISYYYSDDGDTTIKTETYPIKDGYNPWVSKQILVNGRLVKEELNKTRDNFVWWQSTKYNTLGLIIEKCWNDRSFEKKEYKLIYDYVYR